MPDAFAAAEAAVAAVIGDDAPFPHFDERQGHLPGPDRQATRSVLEALPPPPPALVEAIKATEQWTYARAMVLERWCASIKDEAVGEALAPHVHALVAVALPPAPGAEAHPDAEAARRVLPFLVRSCAHTGNIKALAPVAGRGPLVLKESLTHPPKDLGAATRLPPSLARGPLRGLAERTAYLPLGACSSVLRRDADDALRLCDAEALEAALRELRRRIPAVAPPPAHGGLRDWDAREARVLAAALSVVIARLCDGSPSVDATQHAIPASLGLMDASDASTRFVGLECLVRIVTRAPPIILDELHPILLDALDRARALIARDGGGETVALYAHGAVLVIGKVLEPSVRRKAAAVFLDACLDDLGLWRDNAAKLELLRRLADVTLLLGPHGAAAHLRRLLPCLLGALDERAPAERRVVALHALHVVVAQTWARAAGHRAALDQLRRRPRLALRRDAGDDPPGARRELGCRRLRGGVRRLVHRPERRRRSRAVAANVPARAPPARRRRQLGAAAVPRAAAGDDQPVRAAGEVHPQQPPRTAVALVHRRTVHLVRREQVRAVRHRRARAAHLDRARRPVERGIVDRGRGRAAAAEGREARHDGRR